MTQTTSSNYTCAHCHHVFPGEAPHSGKGKDLCEACYNFVDPALTPISEVKPGDIFEALWGYSMSMVSYFQVTKVSGKRVYYQRVASKTVEATGYLAGKCMPVKDGFMKDCTEMFSLLKADYKGRPSFKAGPNGQSSDYKITAILWDGTPAYFNHCD